MHLQTLTFALPAWPAFCSTTTAKSGLTKWIVVPGLAGRDLTRCFRGLVILFPLRVRDSFLLAVVISPISTFPRRIPILANPRITLSLSQLFPVDTVDQQVQRYTKPKQIRH